MNTNIQERLTSDILIQYEDGRYDTNKYGDMWQLYWDVILTEGPDFIGRIRLEGPQLTMREYADPVKLQEVRGKLQSELDNKIATKTWQPISGM